MAGGRIFFLPPRFSNAKNLLTRADEDILPSHKLSGKKPITKQSFKNALDWKARYGARNRTEIKILRTEFLKLIWEPKIVHEQGQNTAQ